MRNHRPNKPLSLAMLRSLPIDKLAGIALDESETVTNRLGAWEAIPCRLAEDSNGAQWCNLGQYARKTIKKACALNMASLGFWSSKPSAIQSITF